MVVRGRKYIRLNRVTFATVEPKCEFLLEDEYFVEKVRIAYIVQVEYNHGWGFTVRHKGYRIRFDLQNTTGYKLPIIYEGYAVEEPENGREVEKMLRNIINNENEDEGFREMCRQLLKKFQKRKTRALKQKGYV